MADSPKPVIPPIDPKKFVSSVPGLDRLKGLLQDVEALVDNVKGRGGEFIETLSMLRDYTVKFGEVVESLRRVVDRMEDKHGKQS